MILTKEIDQNYRFLVSEIIKQMSAVEKQLEKQDEERLRKVESREDYIDVLKNVIETKCFSRQITKRKESQNAVNITRAVHTITVNLERIGDFCVNIMRQFRFFENPDFMAERFDTKPFVAVIKSALEDTNNALFKADLSLALSICRSEFETDRFYKEHFHRIITDMKDGHHHVEIQNLITALFIFRYLERIGDSLLNIGEAILSSILGEKLKIHQYDALEEGLSVTDPGLINGNVGFASMGETRSGCRIGLVSPKDDQTQGRCIIFKDGKLNKIKEEKTSIEKWESLVPGLPPKLYDYRERGNSASLLLECLSGNTFQDILVNEAPDIIMKTVEKICESCGQIWQATLKPESTSPRFMDQLIARLDDVFHVHPEIRDENQFIGNTAYPGLSNMLEHMRTLEKDLPAPFTVLVHGDFNVDNIILNQAENKIHYIDLHRSTQADYLQDASVLLVSIFRLPTLSEAKRPFINEVLDEFFRFYLQFAKKNNDVNFEARLALGLARSYITSTRFQLNNKMAHEMFQRGTYLLTKIVKHNSGDFSTFQLPSFAITF